MRKESGVYAKKGNKIMNNMKTNVWFLNRATKFYVFNGILSLLFSILWCWGIELDQKGMVSGGLHKLILILCGAAAVFMALTWVTAKFDDREYSPKKSFQKRTLIKIFLGVSAVWFLGYLAMFPGVYTTDSPYWYYEFADKSVPITAQWSPIYAGLFYFFVESGGNLFGSWDMGFAIFTFLQMCIVLFAVFRILEFLNQYLSNAAAVGGALFFAFVPTHVILSVSSAQDPLFAACFAMCLLHLLRIRFDTGYISKKRNTVAFGLWLLAMCLLRNNGVYAVIVLILSILAFAEHFKKRLLVSLGIALLILRVITGPGYSALGIQTDKTVSLREMLSFPLQQMAYAYHLGELPSDLKENMELYVSYEGWSNYMPCISDQVKGRLNGQYTLEHLGDFVDLYCKVGAHSPKSYLQGACLQTYGLWFPGKDYPDAATWHPYIDFQSYSYVGFHGTDFILKRNSLFPSYNQALAWLFGEGETLDGYGGHLFMAFSDIPVLSALCKAGTYTWLLLYAACYAVYRRWKDALVILSFPIGIWITVFLSPAIMYRLVAPIIFSAPLIAAVLFLKRNQPGACSQ